MIHSKFLALVFASSACFFLIFCDQTKSEVPAKVKELLLKAIEVHGGMERLSKHRADSVKTKGLIQFNGVEAKFKSETIVQLPDQLKTSQEIEVKGKSFRVVQICNKGEVVMQIDNKQQKAELAIAQQNPRKNLHGFSQQALIRSQLNPAGGAFRYLQKVPPQLHMHPKQDAYAN